MGLVFVGSVYQHDLDDQRTEPRLEMRRITDPVQILMIFDQLW
jgi:hypothetical protein